MKTLKDLKNEIIGKADIFQHLALEKCTYEERVTWWERWHECIIAVEAINKAMSVECNNDRS